LSRKGEDGGVVGVILGCEGEVELGYGLEDSTGMMLSVYIFGIRKSSDGLHGLDGVGENDLLV
jgi:hypothetical protein